MIQTVKTINSNDKMCLPLVDADYLVYVTENGVRAVWKLVQVAGEQIVVYKLGGYSSKSSLITCA